MGEGLKRARDAARATRQPGEKVTEVDGSLMLNATEAFDTECETCQGNGIVTTPEWLEWDKAEREAEAQWKATHPGGGWFGSDARRCWGEQQPDEAEMQCGDCDGKGRKLTDAGRVLLQFLRAHGATEALRRAYTDSREDPAEDQDVQARQHWKALRGWLELSAAKCESAADQGDGNEDLEDVVADYRTEARALRSALAKMTELEAGH